MLDLAGGEVEAVTSQIVGKAYDAGDCLAQEVLSETVALLSVWLGNIVDLLEPDVIIVGGGVAQMLTPFFPQIRDQLSAWCVNSRCQEIPIILAHYGAHAGVAGAAALCSAFFAPSA
jgi:glucokinase